MHISMSVACDLENVAYMMVAWGLVRGTVEALKVLVEYTR